MAQLEHEDEREGFEQYPHPPQVDGDVSMSEPTNAELDTTRNGSWPSVPPSPRTDWRVLGAVVAILVLLLLVTFTIFPLDTWEFRFGG